MIRDRFIGIEQQPLTRAASTFFYSYCDTC